MDLIALALAKNYADKQIEKIELETGQGYYVIPEMYGAVGDGIADDTAAITQALQGNKSVVFNGNKNYLISSTITIPENSYVDFNDATIIPNGNFNVLQMKPGASIENLVVKCTDVLGWNSSVFTFYAGDIFSASKPTRINNVKLYNTMSFNDGIVNSGNGFYLYADDYGQFIEGISITDSLTCGFGKGIYVHSSVPNENEVANAVFIGGNVVHGYWSYRDTYGIYMDAKLPNNKMTNNFFTNLNIQSDYYGGSIYAIYCNGFTNYFGGCIYDYSINVSFQPNTAVYFDLGSQQNTVEVTSGGINRPEWCVDLGGRNRVVKRNDENTVNLPYSEYDNGMIGNQDDALAFIDRSCTCTLESLDSEPFLGNISNVFNPLSGPESCLIYRTLTPDSNSCRATITINPKKHLRKITHFILQFGKRTPPKSIKVTLYTATTVRVIYQTKNNTNRCIVISPELDEFGFVYDVSRITVELSGFNLIKENKMGEIYGEWSLNRIMAVDGYNTGNTWLQRDGGEMYGNIKFAQNVGPVLTGANGKKYMLTISSDGTLGTEELPQEEDVELEVAPLIPVMATKATWYNAELAGVGQNTITSVVFDATYEPSGNEDASWACDEDSCGNIMAYRRGTEVIIAPTTGSETIQLNKESSFMFANDGTNANFSALSSVSGTEMLVAKTDTYMLSALAGNTLITQPICIPDGVTAINKIFYNCNALLTAPAIPDSVTALENAFLGCKAMTTMPNIPAMAKNLKYFVCNCFGITDVDFVIPSTVTNLTGAFTNCRNMNGNIEINATNLSGYTECFKNTSMTSGSITLTGTCPLLSELAATNTQGKVTIK